MRSLSPVVTLLLGLACLPAAQAQFAMVPAPSMAAPTRESVAETPLEYRIDGARHLYSRYPTRIHKGKLPPLMYAIAIIETDIDETGQVVNVHVVREPAAAKEVAPWIVQMIRAAAPFPVARKMGKVRYTEIWLVNKDGNFQLDTLTEGQRGGK